MSEAKAVQISVLIPVGGRCAGLENLYAGYKSALDSVGQSYEFVFITDGAPRSAHESLQRLQDAGEPITLVKLTKYFGEATALMVGFSYSSGATIVTLPAYDQIESGEIPQLIAAAQSTDLAIANRRPRAGSLFERMRRGAFHWIVRRMTGFGFHDLGCNARAMQRRVFEEITLYGDQHRFLPVLAERQGFRVREIDLRQSPRDRNEQRYRFREYTHRVLDLLTVFFLVRFTKKPLRFFGMVGATMFGLGSALIAYLVIDRLFAGVALADRPALLLSSLLVVLGLQLFALGLLGELIIFTHARHIKDYQVDRVIQFTERDLRPQPAGTGGGTEARA